MFFFFVVLDQGNIYLKQLNSIHCSAVMSSCFGVNLSHIKLLEDVASLEINVDELEIDKRFLNNFAKIKVPVRKCTYQIEENTVRLFRINLPLQKKKKFNVSFYITSLFAHMIYVINYNKTKQTFVIEALLQLYDTL